jgi:gliding motility-associated-like protein
MTGTAPGGLTVFKDTVITVHNLPKASFNYSPTIVYIPGQQVTCVNTSTYADNFLWDFGDLTTSEERHPKHAYKDTGLYTIKLRAITSFGCTDSLIIEDAVLAKEAGDMKIPNAFSPNPNKSSGGKYGVEDVSNDVFYPIVVKGYIEDYNMKIYNRWGVKLFESSDLSIGWDGYYNGKLMEQDVYVYVITGKYNNGERFNKIGDILLVRKP